MVALSFDAPTRNPTALTTLWFGSGSKANNDANTVARGDYYISQRNQLSFRYTRSTPYQDIPRVIAVNSQSYTATDQTVNGTFVHTAGNLASSTRFGYNHILQVRTDNGYKSDLLAFRASIAEGPKSFISSVGRRPIKRM